MHAGGRLSCNDISTAAIGYEYLTDREVRHRQVPVVPQLYQVSDNPTFNSKEGLQQHSGTLSAGMMPYAATIMTSATPTG